MSKSYNDYRLKDIPKEFLVNHNNSDYKNTKDVYISSTSEIFNTSFNSSSYFDNIWILLILLVVFDLL